MRSGNAHLRQSNGARSVKSEDFEVHLLCDAVGSRFSEDKEAAFEKMQINGVVPSTVEMALFELLRDAKHEQFKEIQNLIK